MGSVYRIKGTPLIRVRESHDEEATQDAQESDNGQNGYPPVHHISRFTSHASRLTLPAAVLAGPPPRRESTYPPPQ